MYQLRKEIEKGYKEGSLLDQEGFTVDSRWCLCVSMCFEASSTRPSILLDPYFTIEKDNNEKGH
jgi:hypothetical protein